MASRNENDDRDRTRDSSIGQGRGAEREIAHDTETGAGHPLSATDAGGRGDVLQGDMPQENTERPFQQKDRKTQAASPRELTHDEQPKRKEGH
jgi:hypothetical protein